MTKTSWTVELEGRRRVVELDHGTISGKREIRVDGELVEKSRRLFDSGSSHTFQLDGHMITARIKSNGLRFRYDLLVDGMPLVDFQLASQGKRGADNLAAGGVAMIEERLKLENQLRSGANWFFVIAAVSVVNSIIFLLGGGVTFILGLGLTQFVDGVMGVIAEELGADGGAVAKAIGLGFNLIVVGVFVLFGFLSRRGKRWAFLVGMILYGLDILILVWAGDVLGIVFHVIALAGLYRGLKALGEIRSLERLSDPLDSGSVPPTLGF